MATKTANQSRKTQESSSLQLTLIVKSGKYTLGVNQAIKAIRNGQAKLVILANNLPTLVSSQIEYLCMLAKVTVNKFPSSSRELGIALGRPYNVGVMAITEGGDADLRQFEEEK
uniref:Ribosomal protein L30 n=1 Tax=Trepomonas sp. PC1 TaxID=1076344 RepID=A0A146KAF9_9EUKA|eukprot:JAP93810.1 Ribosomal protein L30 [Trepomonas sp. PC1]